MEEFIREQAEMLAEVRDIELTEENMEEIVENLMNADEVWDVFNSYLADVLDSYED